MNWARLHTGTRCGGAIAVGAAGDHITLGERVGGPSDDTTYAGDVQVAVDEGGFVVIRDGRLAGWDPLPAGDLACRNWTGTLATCADIARSVHGRDDLEQRLAGYANALEYGNVDTGQHELVVAARRAALLAVPFLCPWCATVTAAIPARSVAASS